MKLDELPELLRDVTTIQRVYGEPYQVNGVTIIPVARHGGGAGGGSGEGDTPDGKGQGSGGAFGFGATPVGVYVIKGDDVRFVPAIDVMTLATRATVVLSVGLLAWRSAAKARQKRKGRSARARHEPLVVFGPNRSPVRRG